MLVLLAAVVTGAMAQTEELLTTITLGGEPWSSLQPVYTESGRATLETSGTVEEGLVCPEINGWSNSSPLAIGSVTINPAEGYTITKVVFWDYDMNNGYYNALTDNASPFTCYMKGSQRSLNEDMSSPNGNAIAKIEVYGYASTVAVTGVTLLPTTATLTLGETETVTLTATVLPGDATDKSVTWSSSDEAVATVTDGVVTAVAAGTATITVTTTDGAKTATCAVTVSPAASTYTVTLKEGTEDATSWTIAPAEATTTGVAAGTTVTATYSGTKRVKSVKAVKKAAALTYPIALSAVTEEYVGSVVTTSGNVYATVADATAASETAVAMIAYVGSDNGEAAPYNHGLALALSDAGGGSSFEWSTSLTKIHTYTTVTASFASESGLNYNDATHNSDTYPAFKAAIANNGTAAPTGCSSWFLASGYQWKQMIGAAGLSDLGLEGASYWSSTERNASRAWYFHSDTGNWTSFNKDFDCQVRACLAF